MWVFYPSLPSLWKWSFLLFLLCSVVIYSGSTVSSLQVQTQSCSSFRVVNSHFSLPWCMFPSSSVQPGSNIVTLHAAEGKSASCRKLVSHKNTESSKQQCETSLLCIQTYIFSDPDYSVFVCVHEYCNLEAWHRIFFEKEIVKNFLFL